MTFNGAFLQRVILFKTPVSKLGNIYIYIYFPFLGICLLVTSQWWFFQLGASSYILPATRDRERIRLTPPINPCTHIRQTTSGEDENYSRQCIPVLSAPLLP